MSGIDIIISQIEQDTANVCEKTLEAARVKADTVLMQAKEQAECLIADEKDKTAHRVAEIKKRGESAAELEDRRIMLAAKQQMISQMLNNGLTAAKQLPDREYFALIERMIVKYSLPGDGVIVFGKKDTERMPAGFLERISKAANGRLTASDETADIDAGFILKYGGIEQNCSFDAIFAGEAEALSDRAGKLLFG